MEIVSGVINSPQRVVIYGVEGIGKSGLASKFPNPVFIDTEGSTERMNVSRTPKPSTWTMLLQQVSEIQKSPGQFRTLIVDTVDWAQRLCVNELCARHSVDGLEGFGYGKGYSYLAEEFGKLLDALNEARASGLHIVLVGHAAARKFEVFDEAGAYDKWELKLEKRVSPLIKEWADVVLFLQYKIYVVQDSKTKTNYAQGGDRVMYTSHHPCWDAKNRHGLPPELPLDFAKIAHLFGEPAEAKTSVQDPPARHTEQKTVPSPSVNGAHRKLQDLMEQSGIKFGDVIAAIAAKGHFPKDTPFENLPADYIEGGLIPHWDKVIQSIKGETINV